LPEFFIGACQLLVNVVHVERCRAFIFHAADVSRIPCYVLKLIFVHIIKFFRFDSGVDDKLFNWLTDVSNFSDGDSAAVFRRRLFSTYCRRSTEYASLYNCTTYGRGMNDLRSVLLDSTSGHRFANSIVSSWWYQRLSQINNKM